MTQAQFCEVQRKIENFPADDLWKIKSKLDIKNLRNELAKLDMDQNFSEFLPGNTNSNTQINIQNLGQILHQHIKKLSQLSK